MIYKINGYMDFGNEELECVELEVYSDLALASDAFKKYRSLRGDEHIYDLVCYFADEEFCKVLAVSE